MNRIEVQFTALRDQDKKLRRIVERANAPDGTK